MATNTTPETPGATPQRPGPQRRSSMASAPPAETTEPTPDRFASLDLKGLDAIDTASAMRSPRPVADFVIPGLLAGSIAVMVGPGGVSKSMLALQTAGVIASGHDHWHLWTDGVDPIKAGRVAVFNIEDPGIILDTRCHDIAASVPPNRREQFIDEYRDNVRIWPLLGRGFAFGRKAPRTGLIRPTEWIEWMAEKVEGTRLSVVDTFIRGLDGLDENASTEVAPVMAMLEVVARKTGCTFLILHHVNKASTQPGQAAAQGAARGSSALTDNARWQTNLSTMTEAEAQARSIVDERKRWVQVELSKVNYGPPLESRWLYRGEGGVLDGTLQLTPLPKQPKQTKQPQTNGVGAYAAASGGRYPDPRRPRGPDAIDMQVRGDL